VGRPEVVFLLPRGHPLSQIGQAGSLQVAVELLLNGPVASFDVVVAWRMTPGDARLSDPDIPQVLGEIPAKFTPRLTLKAGY
jgi:hypothetical protein